MTETPKRRRPTTAVPVNGEALRELRKEAGLSVATFAERVGVGRPYITKLELGLSKKVSPEVFASLVRVLELKDRAAILGDEPVMQDAA